MAFRMDSKCKHTCKHCYFDLKQGWVCKINGEPFLCSCCPYFDRKEAEYNNEILTQEEYDLLKEVLEDDNI